MPSAAPKSDKKIAIRKIRREGSSLILPLPKDVADGLGPSDFVLIRRVGRALIVTHVRDIKNAERESSEEIDRVVARWKVQREGD